MRLDRDEFVITYDSSKASESDLVAMITKSGYTSKVVTDKGEAVAVEENVVSKDDPIFVAALARAKEENKPLVLDFYADWCAPCLKMLKETIPDPKVASLLKRCVFLKIDADKHPALAKSFGVIGLPDIRFLTPEGSEIKRYQDYMAADAFARELEVFLRESQNK